MSHESFEIGFRLRPVEEIPPWGPEPHLQYFGLTEGCYWLRIGDQEIFRYTDEIRDHWRKECKRDGFEMDTFGEPYDDYQVMRLDDDLQIVLPYSLESVPEEIAKLIPLIQKLRANARPPADVIRTLNIQAGRPPTDYSDLLDRATEWWNQRAIRIFHLRFNPTIHIYRIGDTVHIKYDTRDAKCDGIQVWTADQGEVAIPLDEFVLTVRTFRARLADEMGVRVRQVIDGWSRPDVKIDPEELAQNQALMERSLKATCTAIATTDWNDVTRAIQEIKGAFSTE